MNNRKWIFNAWLYGCAVLGGAIGVGLTVVIAVNGWSPDSPTLASIIGMVLGAGGVILGLCIGGPIGIRREFRR